MSLFFLVKKRRYMTPQEKEIAREVFGHSIVLEKVQIVAHRLVLRHYAISPNGNIYFNSIDWCEDFSKENLEKQSWLIHELVHVWQYQQGIALIRKSILDRRYQYLFQPNKPFLKYGLEQQAQIVQDYFLKSRKGLKCDDLKTCLPFQK